MFRKYLLVVTDGENTVGPQPGRRWRAKFFGRATGAVADIFRGVRHERREVRVSEGGAGRRDRRRQRRRSCEKALDGIYQGRILAEASTPANASLSRGEGPSCSRTTADGSLLSKEIRVIVQKFWSAFMAQINKIANIFWEADPIAQMQYEYDRAVEQLKEGRIGLEQYRGLVERVTRQVAANRVARAEARGRDQGLSQGRRPRRPPRSSRWSCRRRRQELAANEQQLQMHETAYGNNLQEDPARQQEADRAAREDPEVRRRAEDERGRGRDRQARRDAST